MSVTPNIVGDYQPSDDELEGMERAVREAEQAARAMEGIADRQTGSIRGVAKRRAKNKAARQARKANRRRR